MILQQKAAVACVQFATRCMTAPVMQAEQFVSALYRSVLCRPADPAGLAHWVGVLNATADPTAVLAGFIDSDEFRALHRSVERPDENAWTGGAAPVRYRDIAALARHQADAGLPAAIDVIVPVYNAERWIGTICDGYERLGIAPLFIVEGRSTDRSLAILQRRGQRVFTAEGRLPYVESLLSRIIPYLGSRWVLRLDDDELPSEAAIAWIAGQLGDIKEPAVELPRLWVRPGRNHGWLTSDCKAVSGAEWPDHQTRLFRPADVSVIDKLHTCGFEAPRLRAPAEARLYHFDWVIRSHDERARKVARYQEQERANEACYTGYYLPEERSADCYDLQPLEDAMVEGICERLSPLRLVGGRTRL